MSERFRPSFDALTTDFKVERTGRDISDETVRAISKVLETKLNAATSEEAFENAVDDVAGDLIHSFHVESEEAHRVVRRALIATLFKNRPDQEK